MKVLFNKYVGAVAISVMVLFAAQAQETKKTEHSTKHNHAEKVDDVYRGYFDDNQIMPRMLADWKGDWQSVYPLLQDGTLDPVMAHKAEKGDKTAEEYRAKYEVGYRTDVNRIVINDNDVAFYEKGKVYKGIYKDDGYEILNYDAGNRGVRFIFAKVEGDAAAPEFIQFSDHRIAPAAVGHYHLYWGNDRTLLLKELTNWPTYYPSSKSGEEIVAEMTAH
ncbi:ZinT family metal-binding protein [Lentilitoribacter sp. EG35]|uniref:ZinT family metal-binding protein n=1 Tax=Lentilitoribacter sp. EG35 TaxID=3234192 RepID=UPI00346172B6